MNKASLVRRFKRYLEKNRLKEFLGHDEIVTFLSWYIEAMVVDPYEEKDIIFDLPKIIGEAMIYFKITDAPGITRIRNRYVEKARVYSIPDIFELGKDPHRPVLCDQLAKIAADVTEMKFVEQMVLQYLRAEENVVSHAISQFSLLVWQNGLAKRVRLTGNGVAVHGLFGKTTLAIYASPLFNIITFTRLPVNTHPKDFNISFSGGREDLLGTSIHFVRKQVSTGEAVGMIDEVISYWPRSFEEQDKIITQFVSRK